MSHNEYQYQVPEKVPKVPEKAPEPAEPELTEEEALALTPHERTVYQPQLFPASPLCFVKLCYSATTEKRSQIYLPFF